MPFLVTAIAKGTFAIKWRTATEVHQQSENIVLDSKFTCTVSYSYSQLLDHVLLSVKLIDQKTGQVPMTPVTIFATKDMMRKKMTRDGDGCDGIDWDSYCSSWSCRSSSTLSGNSFDIFIIMTAEKQEDVIPIKPGQKNLINNMTNLLLDSSTADVIFKFPGNLFFKLVS